MSEDPEMTSSALMELIDLLERASIDVWLDGGWGVDALLENQTRLHCLSAAVQVLCHAHGYTPVEKDFQDMEKLQQKFGVELPPQLYR